MTRYRVFDHTADLGVQVCGETVEALFINGAFALFDLLTDLDKVQCALTREVTATGRDLNDLWVNYLRESLYVFNGAGLLCSEFAIATIDGEQVTAQMCGELFDPSRHRIKQEIKAVTYHKASVLQTPKGWTGRAVFDV